ncbi:MAG: hypothetical protein J6R85_00905 [Lentisphaeria bacterium]|nr:hypothetical protein [Lentisphaeria bacterium]
MKRWFCMGLLLLTVAGVCAAPAGEEVQRIAYKDLKALQLPDSITMNLAEEVLFSLPAEKWQEFQKLRKKDPPAAGKYVKKEVESRRARRQELTGKINETARQIRRTGDPAEKERLTQELQQLLKQDYERVTNEITNRVRLQEVRLESIRQGLRKRLTAEDQAIRKQLEQMIQPRSKSGKSEKTPKTAETVKNPQSKKKDPQSK